MVEKGLNSDSVGLRVPSMLVFGSEKRDFDAMDQLVPAQLGLHIFALCASSHSVNYLSCQRQ